MTYKRLLTLPIVCLCGIIAGCSVATQFGNSQRSSVEQRLLLTSFDRALATLDTEQFNGKVVTVDFFTLGGDADFMKEYFTAWLQQHHAQIATEPKQAQLHLKVFAPVLAVDQGQSFVGAPAFTVPILGVGIPEITLFKDVKHSGHTELKLYTIDADSGKFVEQTASRTGTAQYDDYTLMLVVHFVRSDVEEHSAERQPAT